MPPRTLYICGRMNDKAAKWDFLGVFTSEAEALAHCKTPSHFIGPVRENEAIIEEPQVWPGTLFPVKK